MHKYLIYFATNAIDTNITSELRNCHDDDDVMKIHNKTKCLFNVFFFCISVMKENIQMLVIKICEYFYQL